MKPYLSLDLESKRAICHTRKGVAKGKCETLHTRRQDQCIYLRVRRFFVVFGLRDQDLYLETALQDIRETIGTAKKTRL